MVTSSLMISLLVLTRAPNSERWFSKFHRNPVVVSLSQGWPIGIKPQVGDSASLFGKIEWIPAGSTTPKVSEDSSKIFLNRLLLNTGKKGSFCKLAASFQSRTTASHC